MITKSVVRKTLNRLRMADLRQLAKENGIDSREKSQGEIISVLLRGGGKDADVEVETVEEAEAQEDEANVELVKKFMENAPNFVENASFLVLLKLYRMTPEFIWLRPILAKKRAEELETLQKWLESMNKNYSIKELTNLKWLYLNDNQITKIPPEIGQLTKLEVLELIQNRISKIPPEIGQLINLGGLYLGKNEISEIPPEIGQLTNLQVLNLSGNKISEIPPAIGQLTKLRELRIKQNPHNLNQNRISKIPPEIGQLTNLRKLDLGGNQISEIPPELKRPGLSIYI